MTKYIFLHNKTKTNKTSVDWLNSIDSKEKILILSVLKINALIVLKFVSFFP